MFLLYSLESSSVVQVQQGILAKAFGMLEVLYIGNQIVFSDIYNEKFLEKLNQCRDYNQSTYFITRLLSFWPATRGCNRYWDWNLNICVHAYLLSPTWKSYAVVMWSMKPRMDDGWVWGFFSWACINSCSCPKLSWLVLVKYRHQSTVNSCLFLKKV